MKKIFCIPYAGGSANVFMNLQDFLGKDIQVVPIELAGRGTRIRERAYEHFKEAVADVESMIINSLDDESIYICGYSMGSLIAFEVAVRLETQGYKVEKLIVAANEAPSEQVEFINVSDLSDEEFMEKLIELGGIPKELCEKKRFLRMMLPIFKSDFSILYEYRSHVYKNKIKADIDVFWGEEDVPHGKVKSWAEHTTGECTFYQFKGNHFFLLTEYNLFAEQLLISIGDK